MHLPFFKKNGIQAHLRLSIHPEAFFKVLIARERAKSDRNGKYFSLLVFSIGKKQDAFRVPRLVNVLKRRIRSIDELGWMGRYKIGLILPETSYEGAILIANHIIAEFKNKKVFFTTSIFVYPESGPHIYNENFDSDRGEASILSFTGKPLPAWKRAIDLIGASVAILLLIPLSVMVMLFIKAVSRGPVFYRQRRIGFLGKPFTCLKFRTMDVDADPQHHRTHVCELIHNGNRLNKIDHKPNASMIPMGNLLRSLGIDELPQLINVLKGDMSLIGPRPCIDYEAAEFKNWQHRRFDIHPGLTGLWQVSGKNMTTFEEMMRLDIRYGQHRCLIQDIAIVLKTFPLLLHQLADTITYKRRARS